MKVKYECLACGNVQENNYKCLNCKNKTFKRAEVINGEELSNLR